MLLACMPSRLTILHWTANWYALPWKDISPVSSFPWLPVVLCKAEPHGLFLLQFSSAVVLVQLTFGQSCW